jgi:hypothetical protein
VLFAIGSTCFAVGAMPWYQSAVGTVGDAATFFVGSIFFTSASFLQLLQAQTPAMAPGSVESAAQLALWNPRTRDRGWLAAATQFPGTLAFNVSTLFAIDHSLSTQEVDRLVWAPDFVGSILFLVASALGILALGHRFWSWAPRDLWWRIAWLNMVGSVFFMISAIGSVVLPLTGSMANARWANAGTFAGAVCFFMGAVLLVPAWRQSAG